MVVQSADPEHPGRRRFLRQGIVLAACGPTMVSHAKVAACRQESRASASPSFHISLAQWSLNRAIFGNELDPLDFPVVAKRDYGIDAVELVNGFYKQHVAAVDHLRDLKRRARDHGVAVLLIMCDDEGMLGDPVDRRRRQVVENHRKWLDWAAELGCHSIRVNAASSGSREDQQRLAADGLAQLTAMAADMNLNVIVENHGGWSSDGQWLASVIKAVDHPRCGTLPDFGNFKLFRKSDGTYEQYDCYRGVAELMPYAKGVSAKSYDFNDRGEETTIDYRRMLKIVLDAGYRSFVGIEYEGNRLSEPQGIIATKSLLERVRSEFDDEQSASPAAPVATQPHSP